MHHQCIIVELLKKSSDGRIVNVGSIASLAGSVDNDTVMARRNFTRTEYNDSKLALLLFTKELARKTTDTGIYYLFMTVKISVIHNVYRFLINIETNV